MKALRITLTLLCIIPVTFGCSTAPKSTSHGVVAATPIPPEEPSPEPNADFKTLGIRLDVDRAEPPTNLAAIADVTKELSRYRRVAYVDLKNWKISRILVSERARRWRNDLYLSNDCLKQGWTACRLSLEPDGLEQLTEAYHAQGVTLDVYGYAYDSFPLLDFLDSHREAVVAELKKRGFDRLIIGNQTRVKSTSHRVQLNGWRHWENADQVQAYWDQTWRTYTQFRTFHDMINKHLDILRIVDVDLDKTSPQMIEKWTMTFQNQFEFFKDVLKDNSVQRLQLSDQTLQWGDRLYLDASSHARILGPEALSKQLNRLADRNQILFYVGKIPVVAGSDEQSIPSVKIEKTKEMLTSAKFIPQALESLNIDKIEISRIPERFRMTSGVDRKTSLILDPPDAKSNADWFAKNLQIATEQRNRNFSIETHGLNKLVKAHVQISYEDHTRVNPDQMKTLMGVLSHNSQWVTESKAPYSIIMSDHMDRQKHSLYVDVDSTWFLNEEVMSREVQRLFLNVRQPSGSQSEVVQTIQNISEMQDLADVDDDGALSD